VRPERQAELLRRLEASGERHTGLFGATSRVQPAITYTDPERFAAEQRVLFRRGPVFAGLSSECPRPGDYLAGEFGTVPIVVVRQRDGSLRAMVNACRHRGAPLVEGTGTATGRFVCGYHAWSYDLDGRLAARPLSDGAFDDVAIDCSLHPRAVAEAHGMIFVRPDSEQPIDVDAFLAGAGDDLAAFGLDRCAHVETRTTEWRMNWKLLLDTFCEAYHIRTLHRETIAPQFDSGCTIFEPFGPHFVNIGWRNTIDSELAKPAAERRLVPYGTIQYFLLPNAMLCHQLDHLELWRLDPVDVRTTRVSTSVFAMEGPVDERTEHYLVKNLDLLLDVVGREDFPLMERIQRTLDSGALPEVVYGRIEPALVHFHQSLDAALAAEGLD
jgi:phenylpropionate dioxygenase-like ring-hydroxylating dioxygenase large terminal subunit